MAGVIQKIPRLSRRKEADLYLSLLRAIVGQQLSVKAAATIWERFLALYPKRYPTAHLLLATEDLRLRGVGLSFQKARYLRNIAEFSVTNTLDHQRLQTFTDEELIEYLTRIKGVGRWTAEMILMFSLGRPDVLPVEDLGIRNAVRTLYSLRHKNKKKLDAAIIRVAEKWRPYRTTACMYLWRYKDSGGM